MMSSSRRALEIPASGSCRNFLLQNLGAAHNYWLNRNGWFRNQKHAGWVDGRYPEPRYPQKLCHKPKLIRVISTRFGHNGDNASGYNVLHSVHNPACLPPLNTCLPVSGSYLKCCPDSVVVYIPLFWVIHHCDGIAHFDQISVSHHHNTVT